MIVYLLTFLLCLFFTRQAERSDNHKRRQFFFSFFAVLIPSFIAGVRDPGIGTDSGVEGYVCTVWDETSYVDDIETFVFAVFNSYFKEGIEFGYLLLNFLGHSISKDIHCIFFLSNALTMFLFYFCAYENRKRASMTVTMAVFLLIYYNLSLNLVRQSIALGFCILSYLYFERRVWRQFVMHSFFSLIFHQTAVIYIGIILATLIWNQLGYNRKKFLIATTLFTLPLLVISMDSLILICIEYGILSDHFIYYMKEHSDDILFSNSTFLIYLIITLYLKYDFSKLKKNESHDSALYVLFIKTLGDVTFCFSLVSKWAYRISYYFNYMADCIFLPRMLYTLKKESEKKYKVMVSALMLLLILYWFFNTVIKGVNETYPYSSEILGI